MVRYTATGNVFENNQKSEDQSGATRKGRKAMNAGKKSPDAFRTISEVADELGVQQHVLRFWETKFTQVKPLKRGGGRRYYRPEDIDVLKAIHNLLYEQGYTIKGVQKLFKEQGKAALLNGETSAAPAATNTETAGTASDDLSPTQRALLESTLGDLRDMRRILTKATS